MKNKLLFTWLAVFFFQPVFSQSKTTITITNKKGHEIETGASADTVITDTARVSKQADTVKVGPVTIIQCKGCEDKDSGKTSSIHIESDKKKKPKNVKLSWLGFDIGINSYIDKSNYGSDEVNNFVRPGPDKPEATEDFFSLRTIKSINVNIWPVLVKVNMIQHVLNLKTGIGIVMNNYRYTKDLTYVEEPDRTYIKLDDIHFTKNKLFTEYLTVPVLLDLTTNPQHSSRAFHFSAGPTFGLLIKSRTKQKSAERNKDKHKGPFNLEAFRTGLRTEIGYGPINFYGSYSLTPIHKYGLKQYPFAVGLSLIW